MNDTIEHRMPTQHLATQEGCCHWAPIVPDATEDPDRGKEETAMPDAVDSAGPPVEKKPD